MNEPLGAPAQSPVAHALPPWQRRAICAGLYAVAGLVGGLVAVVYNAWAASPDAFPYDVLKRELVSDRVEPGGDLAMRRLIDYHRQDCWRQYDRRAVSQIQAGPEPGRVERFEPYVEQVLPIDLSGKWQTWSSALPADFPCGPAYLVETVTTACTFWQRHVRALRKPDIITPFTVTCG